MKMIAKLENSDWVGITIIAVLSVCAFIGFGTFFLVEKGPADLVTELSAGAYGAIFSSVLMMLLLRKQTEHQSELAKQSQQHAKDQEVFKEQVRLFKVVVDQVETVFHDQKVSPAEIKKLDFLFMRLQMLVKREETLRSFRKFLREIADRKPDPGTGDVAILEEDDNNFSQFLSECRLDLGLAMNDFSKAYKEEVDQDRAELIEPSPEEANLPKDWEWPNRATPLALERIERFLAAVQSQSTTEKSKLRYTQQYIAITVEAEGRRPKICTLFEPSKQAHMLVKINVPKTSALGHRVNAEFTEAKFTDGGFKFKIDLDKNDSQLATLEGFIKEAAESKVIK